MTAFHFNDLSCLRGNRLLFDGLTAHVDPGQTLVVTGPNGIGKSSLLRLLAGLARPLSGSMMWDDLDALVDIDEHRTRLTYLGHAPAVKAELTVNEHISLHARLIGLDDPDPAAAAAIDALALGDLAETPGRYLSAGQRRRLALARVAVGRAALWILDEPSTGLDDEGRDRLERLFARHSAGGGLIIVATHEPLRVPSPRTLAIMPGTD